MALTAFYTGTQAIGRVSLKRNINRRERYVTNAESLRASLSALKKKQRAAQRANDKAYAKAYGIKKGASSGNAGGRSKRKKATITAVDGSVAEVGRIPGNTREGGEAVNSA